MGPFDGVMEKAAFEIGRAGNPAKPNLQGMAVAPLHESNRAEALPRSFAVTMTGNSSRECGAGCPRLG